MASSGTLVKQLCFGLVGLLLVLKPLVDAQYGIQTCEHLGYVDLYSCRGFLSGQVSNDYCCPVLKSLEFRSAGNKAYRQAICNCVKNLPMYEYNTRLQDHADELLKHCGVDLPLNPITDCSKVN